jgi:imidazolonepropionase-like amidohydrolase
MSEKLVVQAGRMFDGTVMHGPSSVLVDGGMIQRVWSGYDDAGTNTVDLGPDTCLLPGLIDTHVHLCFDASTDPVAALTNGLATMRAAATAMLRAGITTARDLGDRNFLSLRFREELRSAPEQAPELLVAGPPITTPGGHCHFLGGVAEGIPALRAAVRERAERGCDVIKVMASGGNLTPNSAPYESQYGLEELTAIVEEAHGLGLPVVAHAHAAPAIANALAAGVDNLAHVTLMTADGVADNPDILAELAARGVFVDPTFGMLPTGELPPPEIARRLPAIVGNFRGMLDAGVRFAFGSDSGIAPSKPHGVLPWAAPQAVERLGMSPLTALEGLTSTAADACGVGERKGRIVAGADADLLAVAGDPAADTNKLRDVRAVFRAGIRVH